MGRLLHSNAALNGSIGPKLLKRLSRRFWKTPVHHAGVRSTPDSPPLWVAPVGRSRVQRPVSDAVCLAGRFCDRRHLWAGEVLNRQCNRALSLRRRQEMHDDRMIVPDPRGSCNWLATDCPCLGDFPGTESTCRRSGQR